MKKFLLPFLLLSITQVNAQLCLNSATNYPAGSAPGTVICIDFNGDGNKDLAVANNISSGYISLLLGTSTGSFGAPTSITIGTTNAPTSIASADFNGDTKPDIAIVSLNCSINTSILMGSGSGTFGTATNFPSGNNPYSIISDDFNGDSNADLAIANNGAGTVSVILGTGTGSFSSITDFAVGSYSCYP